MAGQMAWLPTWGSDTLVLHVRQSPGAPWQRYDRLHFAVPEYPMGVGLQHSKGWATFQALLKQGWELVPTAEAMGQRMGDGGAAMQVYHNCTSPEVE